MMKFPLFKLIKDMSKEHCLESRPLNKDESTSIPQEYIKAFKYIPKIKLESIAKKPEQLQVEDDIGKFKYYSKSHFVNFCRYVLHKERELKLLTS